jgi:hypothetical protein
VGDGHGSGESGESGFCCLKAVMVVCVDVWSLVCRLVLPASQPRRPAGRHSPSPPLGLIRFDDPGSRLVKTLLITTTTTTFYIQLLKLCDFIVCDILLWSLPCTCFPVFGKTSSPGVREGGWEGVGVWGLAKAAKIISFTSLICVCLLLCCFLLLCMRHHFLLWGWAGGNCGSTEIRCFVENLPATVQILRSFGNKR